ncbi:hypothetical protein BC834DRAFT_969995 [Gloeopeniophorella convolvens]|nr:hypothetical protein BC834DRAFT_969995 [Gloeopeniophorella convolvens]
MASPKRLQLQIFCTQDVPAPEVLRCSPPYPIKAEYTRADWTLYHMPHVVKHLGRIRDLTLHLKPAVVHQVLPLLDEDAPELEALDLEFPRNRFTVLPGAFLIGDNVPRLRRLRLVNSLRPIVAAPSLVTFVFEISTSGPEANWMDGLVASLHAMPQLRTLRVLLDEQQFSPVKNRLPVSLRELREIEFRGQGIHFETIVGKIDAPCLSTLSLRFSCTRFFVPSLARLVRDSPHLECNTMHLGIDLMPSKLYIESCPLEPSPGSGKLLIKITAQRPDHPLPVQAVFEALHTIFVSVKTLALGFNDDRYPALSWHGPNEARLWCAFIAKFNSVTHLRVDDAVVPFVGKLLTNHSATRGFLPNLRDVLMLYRSKYDLGLNPTAGAEGWRSSILQSRPTVEVKVDFIKGRNKWLSRHAQLGIS